MELLRSVLAPRPPVTLGDFLVNTVIFPARIAARATGVHALFTEAFDNRNTHPVRRALSTAGWTALSFIAPGTSAVLRDPIANLDDSRSLRITMGVFCAVNDAVFTAAEAAIIRWDPTLALQLKAFHQVESAFFAQTHSFLQGLTINFHPDEKWRWLPEPTPEPPARLPAVRWPEDEADLQETTVRIIDVRPEPPPRRPEPKRIAQPIPGCLALTKPKKPQ